MSDKTDARIITNDIEQSEGGWFLVSVMVMTLFLTSVALSVAGLATVQYQHTKLEDFSQNAGLVAEAGIEQSVNQLNTNNTFSGYSSPQVYFNNSTQGMGEYTSTVTTNSDGTSKTIVSTGEIYQPNNPSNPYVTREVRVTVVGTGSTGYSVLSGPGGLILSGSANVTNSEVYIGGFLNMSGAAQIGTSSTPLTVNVANDACPTGSNPGSSYPVVCSNGTQPITMTGSSKIYGSVCATGQTTNPHNGIQGGSGGSGLEAGCTAPSVSPQTYNRMAQIGAVTTTASGSSNTYVCNSFPFNRTWPANLELTGNVSVGSSCNVTIDGNVYITGNLTINGASKTTVANSAGTTDPVVIVDGTITIGGSATMVANASKAGIEFISFKSAASCTTSTTSYCPTISGNNLYNSQSTQTVSVGGAVNVPGMIFDSYWGEVTVSGSGSVGAAEGQTVNLNGAGTVVFGTELSTGSETWTITSYQLLYSSS